MVAGHSDGPQEDSAVGRNEEEVVAWAKAAFAAAAGTHFWLRVWSRGLGTFPNPRLRHVSLRMVCVTLILCNQLEVSSMASGFGMLVPRSINMSDIDELIAMEAGIWVGSLDDVLGIVNVAMAGEVFPVRIYALPERRASPQKAQRLVRRGCI